MPYCTLSKATESVTGWQPNTAVMSGCIIKPHV